MVLSGNVMYKKSLASAIDGQSKARAELAEALPDEASRTPKELTLRIKFSDTVLASCMSVSPVMIG